MIRRLLSKRHSRRTGLVVRVVFAKVRIAGHVEVVVVNVDDFNRVLINKCVRRWVANDLAIRVVDRALVVSVTQLSWTDQRINSWRIDVVSDLLFDDLNVVPLMLIQEWYATLNRISPLESTHDFVIARRIQSNHFAASHRSKNWNTCVTLGDVKLVFLNLLEVW